MKTLIYDIETMANLGWVWGKWEQDVIQFKEQWYMLSFAYKWLGEHSVSSYALPDFKGYKKNKKNDKKLCQKLWELFDEADVVVAHNGVAFDTKKSQAKFLEHGFPPPTPFQQIDTKKVARKYFKFESNKLDELGRGLKVGGKLTHTGFNLWLGCAERDEKKSWKKMVEYNKRDVQLLEDVYLKMRPWISNPPNINIFNGTSNCCPHCGKNNLQRRGFAVTRVAKHQRFQCQSCGAWSQKPINGIIR